MNKIIIALLFALALAIGLVLQPTRVDSYDAFEPREPETPWEYAAQQVSLKWGIGELEYFYKIVEKESNWNHLAANPSSSARGLCQTMMSLYGDDVDEDFLTNAYKQVDWCIEYAEKTYGSPKLAWKEWQRKRWW